MSEVSSPTVSTGNLSGSEVDEVSDPTKQPNESHVKLSIPMASPEDVAVLYNSLAMDKEPPRSRVVKVLSQSGSNLIVDFYSVDVKSLRTAVNSFFSAVILVVETIRLFKPT